MRYHVFVSHNQMEASGDVGTLFHALEWLGVHAWRDMNQKDLTEEGTCAHACSHIYLQPRSTYVCVRVQSAGMWNHVFVLSLYSGMKQGVYDSDVFILVLTNSVLSRKFCQKEIVWAIEFEKPILIVIEEEERFYSFDYERWLADRLVKKPDSSQRKGFVWASGIPLCGLRFDQCPPRPSGTAADC